jgi:transcriptional regulator with XRE-family HTH domain
MVRESGVPLTDICRAIGVTTRWYYMVESGEIKEPSIHKIQRLHDHLKALQQGATA